MIFWAFVSIACLAESEFDGGALIVIIIGAVLLGLAKAFL
ncbi:MAG: hypothetical protein [Bacteriophage sp.]|jgi:hypothetical protein|nr:MAG: hypothetical protein [Bacteriophage sp.]UVN02447.1 MAG: hypothetical protein [Bacteriophage sp.]UVX41962.1 MAG: hypothetical protein [Bacteriophage sp.]UWI10576.1 MAG: hypothetical protein [Bacteriophage sp.]DAL51895.1 MAG TPA_asm: hypothetical protein [Caudoviricetes sp.]